VFMHNNQMYIFGGITINGAVLNDMFKFDFKTNEWEEIQQKGEIPCARWGHSCSTIGNSVYLFGVYSDVFLNDIYEFNKLTFYWKKLSVRGNPPKIRHYHTSVVYKDMLYIIGGYSPNYNHSDIFQYNLGKRIYLIKSIIRN